MNRTEEILNEISYILLIHDLISHNNIKNLSSYFNLSHTILYRQIKNNRLSLKMFKNIKSNPLFNKVDISNDYIINNILMGI